MPFKPNYNQQRSERSRLKDQKKQEKLQKREEETARRKAERGDTPEDGIESPASEPTQEKE